VAQRQALIWKYCFSITSVPTAHATGKFRLIRDENSPRSLENSSGNRIDRLVSFLVCLA
jgi:hypothetical protein